MHLTGPKVCCDACMDFDTCERELWAGPGTRLPDPPLPGGECDAVTGNFVIHATGTRP
jgi:hypothetical protein